MNNLVLTDEQLTNLRYVLEYVMDAEIEFFQDEIASFGDEEGKRCIGYRSWQLARDLGLSNNHFDAEYTVTAAELGFEEDNILDDDTHV
jgi:hypothetical protein